MKSKSKESKGTLNTDKRLAESFRLWAINNQQFYRLGRSVGSAIKRVALRSIKAMIISNTTRRGLVLGSRPSASIESISYINRPFFRSHFQVRSLSNLHTTSRTLSESSRLKLFIPRLTPYIRPHHHPVTFKAAKIPFSLQHAISLSSLPFIGHFFSTSLKKTGIDSRDMAPSDDSFPVQKSEQEWRAVLSREQFRILRQKGTEAPHTGDYDKTFASGTYNCAACDYPLYKSTTKFKSGCGWPAFYEGIPGAIKRNEDVSFGMVRTEIVCGNCGGHLGHVFKGEGYDTPTDERHCVNSVSLKLEKEEEEKK